MASFTAQLLVNRQRFPVQRCSFGAEQATHQRGRVSTKVRYGPVHVLLDVPDGDTLVAWAAEPQKQFTVSIVFLDAAAGSAVETLRLPSAYCVAYQEDFTQGDGQDGAYVCQLTLADPLGWTIQPGGPATDFIAPAAQEHGQPSLSATLLAAPTLAPVVSAITTPAIPPHLGPPTPSLSHKQVQLTAAEWQTLTKGRWDRRNNKKFFKRYRQTEFQVTGDPFTYRVDDKGKVVAVYDAQQSYNITGTRKSFPGIPLTLSGQPTFAGTPHLMPVTSPQKNVVLIEMGGSRAADFRAANDAAGLGALLAAQGRRADQAPKGYTWHHRDDFTANPTPPPVGSCTMELVKLRAHNRTFVHYGACDQCNKHLGYTQYK